MGGRGGLVGISGGLKNRTRRDGSGRSGDVGRLGWERFVPISGHEKPAGHESGGLDFAGGNSVRRESRALRKIILY